MACDQAAGLREPGGPQRGLSAPAAGPDDAALDQREVGECLDEGGRVERDVIRSLVEIGKAGPEQGRQRRIAERPGRKLAHALVLRRDAGERDLQDAQVEAPGAERRGAVGQIGMAGGEAAIGDRKVAPAQAAEPAAAAELLVDADGVTRCTGDVGDAAFDRVGRGLQLDEAGAAELAQ